LSLVGDVDQAATILIDDRHVWGMQLAPSLQNCVDFYRGQYIRRRPGSSCLRDVTSWKQTKVQSDSL